jgi:hypothetical protein
MAGQLGVARVLWAALFASTLIYVVVLELADTGSSSEWQALVPMFGLAAIGAAGASVVIPRFVKKGSSYLVGLILALALAESVCILGFVLGFLGAPPTVVMPFFFVTWALMVARFPTQSKIDAAR